MPSYQIGDSIYFEISETGDVVALKVGMALRHPKPRDARILWLLCRAAPEIADYEAIAAERVGDGARQAIATGVNEVRKLLKPERDRRADQDKGEGEGEEGEGDPADGENLVIIENVRNAGYRLRPPVRRLDAPTATTITIGAFEAPQNEPTATGHALALRSRIEGAFINDDNASRRLLPGASHVDYMLDFSFLLLGSEAMLTMSMRRGDEDAPFRRHSFEDVAIDRKEGRAALLEQIVSYVDAEILRDRWSRFPQGGADWNEQDIEARLTPLYSIVDDEREFQEFENLLKSLGAAGPRVAQPALAALSILYGLRARQTIDPDTAKTRNSEALSYAEKAKALSSPPHVLAELALARAQRLSEPADAKANEALLGDLARICERIPGNVLARTTFVSALLDDPSRAQQAQAELDRLETLYPDTHKPAVSMAMTVIAKARAMRLDVAGAQSALEAAVRLAEDESKRRRAPPFLRYALAVFHNSAARLADDPQVAEIHRAKARATIDVFREENRAELAKSCFNGKEFLMRQLHLAPGWLREQIEASAEDLGPY